MRAKIYGSITGVVLLLGLLKSFLYLRVDPDAQHSGFVYAQAIAVSNGLMPNKNFLSPYGVTGPFLNGLWLKLTTDSLFSLLFLYGIFTVLTGYLIQRNATRYAGRKIAIPLNLSWVLTMGTTIPWPSILSTLLCLTSFTILLENVDKFKSRKNEPRLFLVPVVILLQISVLTRVQLMLVPLVFSIYLICFIKKLNRRLIKFWFLANLITGLTLMVILSVSGILPGYVDQAIIWPLTEFSHPPFNLSWWFSFVWFPLSSLVIVAMAYFGVAIFKKQKVNLVIVYAAVISLTFLCLYLLSNTEFAGSNTDTLRTLPGLIKNTSVNFQFIISYSSAMLFLAGALLQLVNVRRIPHFGTSRFFELEHFIILIVGLTGLSQLYPLRDNVHLWFISPLLIVSATYYFSSFRLTISPSNKSLVTILSCIVLIQLIALLRFALVDREPLKSYELRGLVSNTQFHLGIDKSMRLLDENVARRELRNNCIDSLFSVSKGKYVSIDGNFSSNSFGNFTDVVPIVDARPTQPSYIFECRIPNSRVQEIILQGSTIVFQSPSLFGEKPGQDFFDVLFKKGRN
jgi:hypothetical protein